MEDLHSVSMNFDNAVTNKRIIIIRKDFCDHALGDSESAPREYSLQDALGQST